MKTFPETRFIMTTIRDIAKRAAVSPATVSRVLNGSGEVKPETKARVLATVQAANYHPQTAARNLRGAGRLKKSLAYCIGFFNFRPSFYARDLFSFEMIMAVEAALRERGFGMRFVCASPTGDVPHAVRDGEVDGVITLGKSGMLKQMAALAPTVALDTPNPFMDSLFSIVPDYRSGIHAATARLLDAGCRWPVLLIDPPDAPDGISFQAQVAAGYRAAFEERGRRVPSAPFAGSTALFADGYRVGRALFADAANRPDGVIGSDGGMLGLYRAAAECGLRIPHDLGVIGIDGLGQDDYLSPPLTCVDVGIAELARLAVDAAIEGVLKGERRLGMAVTPVRLVERASVRKPTREG